MYIYTYIYLPQKEKGELNVVEKPRLLGSSLAQHRGSVYVS